MNFALSVFGCIGSCCSVVLSINCVFLFVQFRLVVKTALKLLLVFVEYTESNATLLIQAVNVVDAKRGKSPGEPANSSVNGMN